MFITFYENAFDVMFNIINATNVFDINYTQYSRIEIFTLSYN